jgi:hypothetical protein
MVLLKLLIKAKKENKYKSMKSPSGQSAVEYILLLAVVTLLAFTFFRSPLVKDFFASDGAFFTYIRSYLSYSYRHATPGKSIEGVHIDRTPIGGGLTSGGARHESYATPSETRFFGPAEVYPN